jgi:serine/threonine-protein kinase
MRDWAKDIVRPAVILLPRYNRSPLSEAADKESLERVGSVLSDKWTLERLLGIGGMAAVYAARHRNGARAAVKVLHPELSRHREVRERFLREGYAANRVEHPGVVKVLDDDVIGSGPDAGTAYLVMELLEGESLQDRLERGAPVGEREFLAIAEQVLGVLEVAHARSVVHRDLKPENLFLVRAPDEAVDTDNPRVKVLDFGLARLLDGQTITSYGLALGTPSFMSPEQAAGRIDEIDGRTDLFALAATGFRLRTGRRIHEGANPVELVAKMAHFAAPKIDVYVPDVGKSFGRVIDRALEFRREDRYAGAAEMREDVRRAMAEMDGVARTEIAMSPPASFRPPRVASSRPPASRPPAPSEAKVAALPSIPRAPPLPREATTEVSERDLEPLPVLPTTSRKKRRSLLPWLALVVFAGIGAKLWLDAEAAGVGEAGGDAGSAPEEGSAPSVPAPTVSPAHSPPPSPTAVATPAPSPSPASTPSLVLSPARTAATPKPAPTPSHKPAPKHSGPTKTH